ncbi:MAG: 3-oxoacyl-[acyl-carrier-protein] reductase [Chloroflexi bacterium]|nr:3-oxoacyl-[acyl-carrier-protein] reductase [Chloroflexota bacterium]MDA1240109.1 3-oxoacyl-[acyl-carrier-protein] reductase [Chloroflexota bacterium]MQC25393.1 3-oxoacyl-[acyl-carrier-protein] reductase [Chloroflexota bacterium]MQC48202.1 3-oxoacyl-[acyl-carrier-protein] reductase [Chloroflexota bacterium]
MTGLLAGKNAVVTGGGRGIGRAIATALAEQGANVLLTYRGSQAAAEAVATELSAAHGVKVLATQCDVRDSAEVDRLFETAKEALGAVHVLVNNAGITADTLVMRMSEEAWDDVVTTNLRGTFLASKVAVRGMLRERWGRIINISSVVGVTGNAGQANYAAAKAGIIGFTRSLAQEVATRGITVNAIAPGFVLTDMTSGLTDEQKAAILGRIPMARWGEASEIAAVVAFLASDAASYITGQVINVDGGLVTA